MSDRPRIPSSEIVFDCSSDEPGATEGVTVVDRDGRIVYSTPRTDDTSDHLQLDIKFPRGLVPDPNCDRRFMILEDPVRESELDMIDLIREIAASVEDDGRAGKREPFYRKLEYKGRRRY